MEFEEAVIEISLLYKKAKELLGDDLSEVWRHGVIDFWADVHKSNIDGLIDDATMDVKRFEIIAKSIAKLIENDVPLTEKAKLWLVGLLNGEISKPDSKAGRKTTTGRDSFIVFAINKLRSEGMPIYPKTPPDFTSACEVVHVVFKSSNLSLKTIENIWSNKPRDHVFGRIEWAEILTQN